MKGDFSRNTFDPQKHYAGVLMQQGRVQDDADWNEQQAIQLHRGETEARDVIGPCGAPMDNAGFAITVQQDNTLLIGKGRFYVDGILCENAADVPYAQQPYLPNATPPDVVSLLQQQHALWGIVYLDVWRRHITVLDDNHIREVALGGPDTATRMQTIWQVKILPIPLSQDTQQLQTKLEELTAQRAKLEKSRSTLKIREEIAALTKQIDTLIQELARFSSQLTCISRSNDWDSLVTPSTGTLNARTQPQATPADPCNIPPSAGYTRLENQLYRVEVHLGSIDQQGAAQDATFKWSRENGSVVTTITGFSGSDVIVHDIGPDDVLGFAPGQWVEIIDDERDLKGLPGDLLRIQSVTPTGANGPTVTLENAPTPVDPALNPKLRRWEQMGPQATPDDVKDGVQVNYAWQDLEGGIQVQFAQGSYKTGDYWLIPARTATGDIEWPPYTLPATNPQAQAPLGIHHHYCRLGLLSLNPQNQQLQVQDCRERFPALASPAIHVLATNWQNDDLFLPQQFVSSGLNITLDAAPEQLSVSPATVIVTVELSAGFLLGRANASNEFLLSFILNGTTTVADNVIHWMLQQQGNVAGAQPDATVLGNIPRFSFASSIASVAEQQVQPRIRVTLKGHDIWSNLDNERYYLDGQAFGQPGTRADGATQRTALQFPSGAGILASDFESWFYLGQTPPLQIQSINFLAVAQDGTVTQSSAGLIKVPPLPPQQPVQFNANEGVNTAEIAFTRAIDPNSLSKALGGPQSVSIASTDGKLTVRGVGSIADQSNQLVRFTLKDPPTLQQASEYQLTVYGAAAQNVSPITAQSDGTPLFGDFKDAGSDFVLPFTILLAIQ